MKRSDWQNVFDWLGLTKLAAVCLAGYYVFFFTIQQIMPDGQGIFRSVLGGATIIATYIYLTIIYAGIQEVRHGGVRLSDKTFWVNYLKIIAVSAIYLNFFNSFGYAKSMVPLLHPFYLDPFLQKWDIFLSRGTVPFHWAADLLSSDMIYTFSMIYFGAWGFVMTTYVLWQLAMPPSIGRTQFLSSFVMVWVIGGVVIASLCASVGPIFYAAYYTDQYSTLNAQLVAQLYGARPDTDIIYHVLLDLAKNDIPVEWNGISAMPSMHTAIVMLLVIHSAKHAKRMMVVTVPLAIAIITGSIILGWHYILDTYISAIIVYAIWRANTYILQKRKLLKPPCP